jgi:hypothetical protein
MIGLAWFDVCGHGPALISTLDLVISVDTSVRSRGWRIGKTVWVMLPLIADWRWLPDREGSPWYPAVRLFRQDENTRVG